MRYSLSVLGATLVDGLGSPSRRADVGIVGDTIEFVGDLQGAPSDLNLAADGLVVAPGFIDVHSHSDPTLLVDPSAATKIRQGVTTELVGNCGMSVFPSSPGAVFLGMELDSVLGRPVVSLRDYAERLEEDPPALNVGILVGIGSVLRWTGLNDLGFSAVLDFVDRSLGDGALGLSIGLTYDPDRSLTHSQLWRLGKLAALHRKPLAVHLRDEGAGEIGLEEAVAEILALADDAECAVQISHLKGIGPSGWKDVGPAVRRIADAIASGSPIAADVYPYTSTETLLAAAIRTRSSALEEIDSAVARRGGAARLVISHARSSPDIEGKSLTDAATMKGMPVASLVGTLLRDPTVTVVSHSLREEDVAHVVGQAWCCIASDGMAFGPSIAKLLLHPHPRSSGTFPRLFARYVRDRRLLSLEEAVRKCTSLPADLFNVRDRGRLAVGAKADLVVFDPTTIRDRASYEQPTEPPDGIHFVVVNGRIAVRNGQSTEARVGRVLRLAT